MFPSLRPILNKGGAGRYISRAHSAERLQPIAERHIDLMYAYEAILDGLPAGLPKERLEALMPYLRTEIAKMSETILSLGGTPPSGVRRVPGGLDLPEADSAAGRPALDHVDALLDAERDFGGAIRNEVDAVHHQERTRAILTHNAEASDARRGALRDLAADLQTA
ncbi:hypothetical protein RQM47_15005 [Rubrivirga sp. S365]|uniref:DUF2383 domain-containing protein n=1 Tax=Rubrivirga litoralis TaxID=3075598 RepID=A0ABU3BRI1_9BACT|nr:MULTISPECIES: hypothetical protein [unclassified Rubrivirga]MDT0631900.1 hypothetical protein [Rubrivirga sp. F394]MDT7857953.1 hypothetical protein [Rubrivirga sp. S365]